LPTFTFGEGKGGSDQKPMNSERRERFFCRGRSGKV
jgi:hypothetical protein